MEIAAAGGHNIFNWSSGAGKLCLPSGYQYLPPMTLREALETTKSTAWREN
jgi:predicted ATPase with chaperone activity